MEITELKPPRPWVKRHHLPTFDFGAAGVLNLSDAARKRLPPLDRLLFTRRSQRDFSVPITLQQLDDLLWHSFRVRRKESVGQQVVWETRPTPSGGGCYPIRILVLRAPTLEKNLLIYEAEFHAFGVRALDPCLLKQSVADVEMCLKVGCGTVLWFIADLGRSGAKYRSPESLAWRDSGALLATLGLVSEGLGLNCCGLGLHDIPSLRRFLKLGKTLIGVGGCVVSRRASVAIKSKKHRAT